MNSQGLNSILANIASLTLLISISSCSKNDVVNVVYQINEYHNNGFHVTFSINNNSSIDLDSPWSLHWNQQSSIIDESSIKDNVKYEYVAGQSYNILSFGKDLNLKSNEMNADIHASAEYRASLVVTAAQKAVINCK